MFIYRYLLSCLLLFPYNLNAETIANYHLSYKDEKTLHVSVKIKTANNRLTLIVPTKYGPVSGAQKGIKNLHISNKECGTNIIHNEIEKEVYEVDNCQAGEFDISYELKQISDTIEHSSSAEHYLPVINDRYIKLINILALVVPWPEDEKITSTIKYHLKDKSTIFSNLNKTKRNELTFQGNIYDFLKSFSYITKDKESLRTITDAGAVSISIDNIFKGHEQGFGKAIHASIEKFTNEFGGFSENKKIYAALTQLKSDDGLSSIDGLALNGLFWVQATTNHSTEEISLYFIHEILHTWLPNKFIKSNFISPQLQFFTEGFTEYLGLLILLEQGVLTQEKFNGYINNAALSVKNSEFSFLSIEEWLDYYDNPPYWLGKRDLLYKVPYHKGLLLALKWDEKLKQKGKSLFSVIRTMLDLQEELSMKSIVNSFTRAGLQNAANDINTYVYHNNGYKDFIHRYSNCASTIQHAYEVFDFGFSLNEGQPIDNININSNAHHAGVRNGMIVVYSQFYYGEVGFPVTIKTDKGEEFKYKPSRRVVDLVVEEKTILPLTKKCDI